MHGYMKHDKLRPKSIIIKLRIVVGNKYIIFSTISPKLCQLEPKNTGTWGVNTIKMFRKLIEISSKNKEKMKPKVTRLQNN